MLMKIFAFFNGLLIVDAATTYNTELYASLPLIAWNTAFGNVAYSGNVS